MKLVKVLYKHHRDDPEMITKFPPFWNLLLETEEEVIDYMEYQSNKEAYQLWEALGDRNNVPSDKIIREKNPMEQILSVMINTRPGTTHIGQICQEVDIMQDKKLATMLKIIRSGDRVRVSTNGGYSNFGTTMYHILHELECDKRTMMEYLLGVGRKCEKLMEYLLNKTLLLNDKTVEVKFNKIVRISYYKDTLYLTAHIDVKAPIFDVVGIHTARVNVKQLINRHITDLCKKYFGIMKEVKFNEYDYDLIHFPDLQLVNN